MRSSPSGLQRKPAITQSAVRYGLTLSTPSREPGRYGRPSRLQMTPSRAAESRRSSHSRAPAGGPAGGAAGGPAGAGAPEPLARRGGIAVGRRDQERQLLEPRAALLERPLPDRFP